MPTSGELLNTFRRVDGETVTAWKETVSDAPLVATAPLRGRVVEEKKVPEINVTDWTLSNGMRVVVKPTDFKADEVIIQAWSPGGTSLVSDADYVDASLAYDHGAARRGCHVRRHRAGQEARGEARRRELRRSAA